MRRFRAFAALVLLALWLPATLHCALEEAGLLHADGCCAEQNVDHCDTDACAILETGFVNSTSPGTLLLAKDAALLNCCCLLCVAPVFDVSAPLAPAVEYFVQTERAVNWLPTWSFAHRLALPARAPSLA